jgi:hypothetical protein
LGRDTWNDNNLLFQTSLKERQAGMDTFREMRHYIINVGKRGEIQLTQMKNVASGGWVGRPIAFNLL